MLRLVPLLVALLFPPAVWSQLSVVGLGLRLAREPVEGGRAVETVVPWSPAADAGIEVGQIVRSIDGRPAAEFDVAEFGGSPDTPVGRGHRLVFQAPERAVELVSRPLRGLVVAGDAQEGSGTYQDIDGSVYTGKFHRGRYAGPGRLMRADGAILEGTFVDGVLEGVGSVEWSNGDRYEGEFRAGICEGRGSLWREQFRESCSGEFVRGKLHGAATVAMAGPLADFDGVFADGQPVSGMLALREADGAQITPASWAELRLLAVELRRQQTVKASTAGKAERGTTVSASHRETWGLATEPTPTSRPAATGASVAPSITRAFAATQPCRACCATGRELERCPRCAGTGVVESVTFRTKTSSTPYVARSVYDSVGRLVGQQSGYDRRTEQIREVHETPCTRCVRQSGLLISERTCRVCSGAGTVPPPR